jgi:hypothetical protein
MHRNTLRGILLGLVTVVLVLGGVAVAQARSRLGGARQPGGAADE